MTNTHTTTALNRWSVADATLPPVEKIKAIHVYDFDNTLFNSPLPNPKIWAGPTLGLFQQTDGFASGGWWHDSRILAATGMGMEKERERAWEGWWNERIVELVRLSEEEREVVTVLLTGRAEPGFADLIKMMAASKGLNFDMVVLKPPAGPGGERFASTMAFKQVFLTALMETYHHATEIRVYEDRVKHVRGFRDFFMAYNKRQHGLGGKKTREPIQAEVIQVADSSTVLDPVSETAEIMRLVNDHNKAVARGSAPRHARRLAVKKTVFYTGYLITSTDTQRLLSLVDFPPPSSNPTSVNSKSKRHNRDEDDDDVKFLGNNIMITPRPATESILEKVGGLGAKVLFQAVALGHLDSKVWAVQVKPVPHTVQVYTENPTLMVVLALKGRNTRPIDAGRIRDWVALPEEKMHVFETSVGEKVVLRVEEEDGPRDTGKKRRREDGATPQKHGGRGGYQGRNNFNGGADLDDFSVVPKGPSGRGGYAQRNDRDRDFAPNNNRGGRGGHQNNRGGRGGYNDRGPSNRGGGGGGRGRGRGGNHHYRSLDDMGSQQAGYSTQGGGVQYEDYPALPTAHQKYQQNNGQAQRENERHGGGGGGGAGYGGGGGGGNVGQYY
jgi:hypothetical protein